MLAAMQYAPKGQTIHMALRAGLHAAKHPIEFPTIIMVNEARLEELQITISWKTTERLRKPFDKLWTRKISSVLTKAGEAAGNAYRGNGKFGPVEAAINEAFKVLPALYERMYRQVGGVFADRAAIVARRLLGQEQRSNVFEETPEARKWVRTQTGKHIAQASDFTKRVVKKLVDESFTEGLTMVEIARDIKDSHGFSASRAFRIARTEVAAASNAGNHFATAAILPKDRFSKVWLSSRDVRVRDSHRGGTGAEGQTRDMDKPFNLPGGSLMFPGDSSLGASGAEIIQCRCTTIHKPKKGAKPSRKPKRPQALPPAPPVRKPVRRSLSGIHPTPEVVRLADLSRNLTANIVSRAQQENVTVAAYKLLVEEKAAKLLKKSNVYVRVSPATLDNILDSKSKRLKSQFETGSSGGLLDNSRRSRVENRAFSIPVDSAVKKRPIYGYLSDSPDGHVSASEFVGQYGNVIIKTKPNVKSFTTFTSDDSLSYSASLVPSPVNNPSYRSLTHRPDVTTAINARSTDELGGYYVEAQMHGGVSMSDIDTVFFRNKDAVEKFGPRLKDIGVKAELYYP